MKKVLLITVLMYVFAVGFSQSEFPYSKILRMSQDELKENKFKYDTDKNQYVLKKRDGWQSTANVLSALGGTTADIRPHVDDYEIILQYGDEGVSSLTVIFYNDNTYHELMTFAVDRCENFLETDSNTKRKAQFNYDGFAFELNMEILGITSTTGRTNSAIVKTQDESYNIYTYSIFTGIEPNSKWLQQEAKKQQQRDDKGKKKRTAADLM
ncbi:MAG: hypothetical protein LBV26_05970 [Bacteroidales bacterium]|jgi:hypothetical protein|nr:hypothetical protein [Bacteroidales bacterium]